MPLESLIPQSRQGQPYLPPRSWAASGGSSRSSLFSSHSSSGLLNNGTKSPNQETFAKYVQELSCSTDDGLRTIGRRKLKSGHHAPKIDNYKRFWTSLEMISQYWETVHDHYYEDANVRKNSATSLERSRKSSLSNASHFPDASMAANPKRYKGFRVSTGAKMPEGYRVDAARAFLGVVSELFGCKMTNPRRVPMLELQSLQIPVTQTAIIWRLPGDKAYLKQGYLEGPVLGLQCRAETAFVRDHHAAIVDVAREIAGLLLLAQERAREGKAQHIPGAGKWYTTKPRWGGGPGGEFGEAEGNKDIKPQSNSGHHLLAAARRHSTGSSTTMQSPKMTEEEIWRQLKPGNGTWEPRMTYLAVGKDRIRAEDCVSSSLPPIESCKKSYPRFNDDGQVFMVSCVYHHISILKLEVHPVYMDFLTSGKSPAPGHPDPSWCAPKIYRSKWFDLLLADDRVDALRAIWGVLAYSMRVDDGAPRQATGRQNSEISHGFSFRKKPSVSAQPAVAQRSSSVAF